MVFFCGNQIRMATDNKCGKSDLNHRSIGKELSVEKKHLAKKRWELLINVSFRVIRIVVVEYVTRNLDLSLARLRLSLARYFDKFLKLLLLQYLLAHCKVLSSQISELSKLLRSYSILNTPNYRGRCLMLLDGNSESKTVIIS